MIAPISASSDTSIQDVEHIAIDLWMKETGRDSILGWGSVPETYEYRKRAKAMIAEQK